MLQITVAFRSSRRGGGVDLDEILPPYFHIHIRRRSLIQRLIGPGQLLVTATLLFNHARIPFSQPREDPGKVCLPDRGAASVSDRRTHHSDAYRDRRPSSPLDIIPGNIYPFFAGKIPPLVRE